MVAPDETVPGWEHAAKRLHRDPIIWITTVRADGQPQSSAVWFHWAGEDFLVVSQPAAAKVRNLAANPRVSLHLDSDGRLGDLVIVEGAAEVISAPEAGGWPDAERVGAYYAKYDRTLREHLNSTPEEMRQAYSTTLRITPTRWRVNP